MQKLIVGFLLVLVLAACGDEEKNKANDNTSNNEEQSSAIDVDKGLLNVEVTIPPDFLGESTEEEIRADAKEQGIKEITFNDDGSVTYKMSKSDHKKILKEMATELDKSLEEMSSSGDFPSVQKVTANKDYTQFDLTVNREEFENGMDSFAVLGLMLGSAYYQMFDGKTEDDTKFVVNYIDADTGEVFETEDLAETEGTAE
ncbi:MAG: hypothetical protein ABS882_02165 [Lysinibacillus sp.]